MSAAILVRHYSVSDIPRRQSQQPDLHSFHSLFGNDPRALGASVLYFESGTTYLMLAWNSLCRVFAVIHESASSRVLALLHVAQPTPIVIVIALKKEKQENGKFSVSRAA